MQTHDKDNQIVSISPFAGLPNWADPDYDGVGNTKEFPRPGDLTNSYIAYYDAWYRLVKITDGSNTIAEYEYDGANRRIVKKTYAGGLLDEKRHYYYDANWRVVDERIENGSNLDLDRQFIWGLRYIDELVLRDRDTDNDGDVDDERLYALQDSQYNVTAIADDNGSVVERYAYSATGVPKRMNSSYGAPTTDYGWETRFCGYRFDSETGLYHVRMRMYHAELGRWLQRDPLEYVDSMNLYEYVKSNPINSLDPMGLDELVYDYGDAFSAPYRTGDGYGDPVGTYGYGLGPSGGDLRRLKNSHFYLRGPFLVQSKYEGTGIIDEIRKHRRRLVYGKECSAKSGAWDVDYRIAAGGYQVYPSAEMDFPNWFERHILLAGNKNMIYRYTAVNHVYLPYDIICVQCQCNGNTGNYSKLKYRCGKEKLLVAKIYLKYKFEIRK